jgi:hypothetical protein
MTSSILCAQTGIDTPEILENSASYIAGWLRALNQDTRLVVTAAAQAQRACDLITEAEREPAREHDRPRAGAAGGERRMPIPVASAVPGDRQRAGTQRGEREPEVRGGGLPPARVPRPARGSQHSAASGGPVADSPGETAYSRAASASGGVWPELVPERGGVVSAARRAQPAVQVRGWQAEAG